MTEPTNLSNPEPPIIPKPRMGRRYTAQEMDAISLVGHMHPLWAEATRQILFMDEDGNPLPALYGETVEPLPAVPPPPERKIWKVQELLEQTFPPVQWALPGWIPEGLTILAGRPKVGKSWLALQIAQAVATGGEVLGEKVKQGSVFYLAMEDAAESLQERLARQRFPSSAAIEFCFEWTPFSEGGLEELEDTLSAHPYALVVIDTASRVLGNLKQRDEDAMTPIYATLQRLGFSQHSGVLVIDHHAKPGMTRVGDPIDDILGSTAKAAVADGAMGLYRDPERVDSALLSYRGRRSAEKNISLRWDAQLCSWQFVGQSEPFSASGERGKVLETIRSLPQGTATITQIAKLTGMKIANVSNTAKQLIKENYIRQIHKAGSNEKPYILTTANQEELLPTE